MQSVMRNQNKHAGGEGFYISAKRLAQFSDLVTERKQQNCARSQYKPILGCDPQNLT